MTASAYLSDDQIERLANLLEQRAVPFRGFNLEALDGYLSALALSPVELTLEQWEPAVWGKTPRWDDADERARIEAPGHDGVVVAQHHEVDALVDGLERLGGLRPVADDVAEADDAVDLVHGEVGKHRVPSGKIAVYVRDDRVSHPFHHPADVRAEPPWRLAQGVLFGGRL